MKVSQDMSTKQVKERHLKELQKLNSHRELELTKIRSRVKKEISNAKFEGEQRAHERRLEIDQKTQDAIFEQEKKINNIQTNQQSIDHSLVEEKSQLSKNHKKEINLMAQENALIYQTRFDEASAKVQEISAQTGRALNAVKAESEHQTSMAQLELGRTLSHQVKENENKISVTEKGNRQKEQWDKIQYAKMKAVEKNRHESTLQKLKNKHKIRENQEVSSHQNKIKIKRDHNSHILKMEAQSYQSKLNKLKTTQEALLSHVKTRNRQELEVLINGHKDLKKTIKEKDGDPFYNVAMIHPEVKEMPHFVKISIRIPEFEKENIHISTDKRQVRIHISRRFQSRLESKDGSLNKSSRSETYTKELHVRDILDPTQITQKYAQGVLTFKIAKL